LQARVNQKKVIGSVTNHTLTQTDQLHLKVSKMQEQVYVNRQTVLISRPMTHWNGMAAFSVKEAANYR
jgi:hypothetical protein